MAARLARLKTRPQFLKVAASRRKWVTPGLILQARRRPPPDEQDAGDAPIRVGFTVSRKVGNAVRRNRARRRLRAAAAEVLGERGRPGHDYVIVGRQGTLTRPYPELLSDLRQALERVEGQGGRRGRTRDRREESR